MDVFEPIERDGDADDTTRGPGPRSSAGSGALGRRAAGAGADAPELHLVKLAVGAPNLATMAEWVAARADQARRGGPPVRHRTRMNPRRADELLRGGSLYWVISGAIRARQGLIDVVEVEDDEGRAATDLILGETLVPTAVWPRRPFQGWRYLKPTEAPPDLENALNASPEDLDREAPPPALLAAIAELGVR